MVKNNSITKIPVTLMSDEDKDYLKLKVGSTTHELSLGDDSQEEIKSMFCDLIGQLRKTPVTLELTIDKSCTDSGTLKEVAKEYIDDLNEELSEVREKIESDFNKNDISMDPSDKTEEE